MLRKIFVLVLLLNTAYLQAQEYNFNPRNRDLRLLKRNNFDPYYEGQNLQVNESLELAFRKNKYANGWLITSAVVSSIPLITFFSLPGFIYGYALKLQSRKQIRIASLFHLTTLTTQTYAGKEDFRRSERIRWYEKKNFHIRYYNGQNEEINTALNESWDLKRKVNRDKFFAGVSGSVGGTLLLISLINFIVNTFSEGSNPVLLPFATGAILTTTGTLLFIKSDKQQNQVELNLWNATEQWYTELHSKTPNSQ